MKKYGLILIFMSVFLLLPAFSENSADYVDLKSAAGNSGIQLYWDPVTKDCVMEKNGHTVSFNADENCVLHDYVLATFEDKPVLKDGVLQVTKKFLDNALNYFQKSEDSNPYRIGAILIDPGHGGKDPGASATHVINGKKVTVKEKDINLNVGLKIYNYLKKAYPDKKILMTRSTDVYITLQQRTEIANSVQLKENEAILYVSIHVNASLDTKASGYEVWYLSPGYRRQVIGKDASDDATLLPILNSMMEEEYTTESILIAKFILEGISAQVGKLSASRGIKAEEWFVVRNANMPSVLVETGFLTNPVEGPLLADDAYLQKLSFGIYNGLQAFVTHFERSRGFTGKNE